MIHRGDVVRLREGPLDYYGTARTSQGREGDLIRVQWHPEFGTWEQPAALVVVSFLGAPAE